MSKHLTFPALAWSLLLTQMPQAHAAWQHVNPGQAIPLNALPAFYNNLGLSDVANPYICRASYAGGVHPGWVSPSTGTCAFGWGGLEQQVSSYDIWVDEWELASNGNVPANAFAAGSEQYPVPYPELSVPLPRYVCQARDPEGGEASGKVAPDIGSCDFPYGGVEEHATSYNVLIDSGLANIDSAGGDKLPLGATNPVNGTMAGNYLFYATGQDEEYLIQDVASGQEAYGPTLYVCSAYYLDGMQIGKTRSGFAGCDISFGGRETYVNPSYTMSANWVNQGNAGGFVPVAQPKGNGTYMSSIIGGQEADGTTLYLCLAYVLVDGNWVYLPGKLRPGIGGCSIGYQGQEIINPTYSVLGEMYTTPVVVR